MSNDILANIIQDLQIIINVTLEAGSINGEGSLREYLLTKWTELGKKNAFLLHYVVEMVDVFCDSYPEKFLYRFGKAANRLLSVVFPSNSATHFPSQM